MSLIVANNANLWGKASKPFVTEWTVPDNTTVTLPHLSGYVYTYFVDWGDGSPRKYVAAYNDPNASHTYAVAGTYEVKIVGTCESFWVSNGAMKGYITKHLKFGDIGLVALNFYGCSNLTGTIPDDSEGLNKLVNGAAMYFGTSVSGSIPSNFLYYSHLVTNLSYALASTDLTGIVPVTFLDHCTELTNISNLFSGSQISGGIPVNFLIYCTKLTNVRYLFRETLVSGAIPANLFINCTLLTDAAGVFWICPNITGAIPAGYLSNCTLLNTVYGHFRDTGISNTIPNDFLSNHPYLAIVSYLFYNTDLSGDVPANLFANSPNITEMIGTFRFLSLLTGDAPAYWLRVPEPNGTTCFGSCNFDNQALIPATWK